MSRERDDRRIRIVEVGPRDGLQNEPALVPTAIKIRFVERLSAAGLADIETTSFVNHAAVPQLADAADVMRGIGRRPGIRYSVLVPNERGLDRAIAAGAEAIALFAAATDAFSLANLRASIDETFVRFAPVAARARSERLWLRGYVSVAFGCPFSGDVAPSRAVDVAHRLFDLGCDEVAFADTIGCAAPSGVAALLDDSTGAMPVERVALHLHDTNGNALANVAAALPFGIRTFDGAAGGLGGCPFAPGAPGNVATERLVDFLHNSGFETGVDSALVRSAVAELRSEIGLGSDPSWRRPGS